MALKKCKECDKEVSSKATDCPHCGAPIRKKAGCLSVLFMTVLGVFGLFIVLAVIGGGDSKSKAPSTPTTPQEVVYNSPWDGSVRQVVKHLEKNLRDPDSFEAIEWGTVVKSNDGFVVRLKYRAKNGFGGYAVSHEVFTLDKNGNVTGQIPWTE